MHAWRDMHPSSLGLVPTMGYLHSGHLSLVQRSIAENALTVASIFVNPTQFGPGEDLQRYPRDEGQDLRLLREMKIAAVYLPTAETMYPVGYQTYVLVEGLTDRLEGYSRPEHFRGVTTVVTKLLNAVRPDRAYFGRKDAQQLRVIQRLVHDLDLPADIVACKTVREADGLPMSSRNVYLTPDQRAAAPIIHQALLHARRCFNDGELSADALREIVTDEIQTEPLADIDYVSLADSDTLAELTGNVAAPALLSVAARFDAVRLIDNIELG